MVEIFATIGIGQWFRYVVGAFELAGAVGVLIPQLSRLAALGLVCLMYIRARLIDEISIHLVPVLFSSGTRMFEHLGSEHIQLETTGVIETPAATHLRFRVVE